MDELGVALQGEWVKIDMDFINALIESTLPKRIKAVSLKQREGLQNIRTNFIVQYIATEYFSSLLSELCNTTRKYLLFMTALTWCSRTEDVRNDIFSGL